MGSLAKTIWVIIVTIFCLPFESCVFLQCFSRNNTVLFQLGADFHSCGHRFPSVIKNKTKQTLYSQISEIWEHSDIVTTESDERSDEQTGIKQADRSLYLELNPKVSAPEMPVIMPESTEKPGSWSVNCDRCLQRAVWVIILQFPIIFS